MSSNFVRNHCFFVKLAKMYLLAVVTYQYFLIWFFFKISRFSWFANLCPNMAILAQFWPKISNQDTQLTTWNGQLDIKCTTLLPIIRQKFNALNDQYQHYSNLIWSIAELCRHYYIISTFYQKVFPIFQNDSWMSAFSGSKVDRVCEITFPVIGCNPRPFPKNRVKSSNLLVHSDWKTHWAKIVIVIVDVFILL